MSQNSTMCSVFNNILKGYKYIQYNTRIYNTLCKKLFKVWKIALISCCYSHLKCNTNPLKCNTNPRVAILFLNVSNYSIKENKWESLYLQITQGLRFPENAIKMDHNWEAIQGYVRIPSRMWRRIRISLCIQRS